VGAVVNLSILEEPVLLELDAASLGTAVRKVLKDCGSCIPMVVEVFEAYRSPCLSLMLRQNV